MRDHSVISNTLTGKIDNVRVNLAAILEILCSSRSNIIVLRYISVKLYYIQIVFAFYFSVFCS